MKSLVLAEKPSVAKEIAHTFGCNTKGNGYFEGSQYIITWALGHLVTLKTPEDYGDKYKSWTVDTLPMIPEKLETKIIPGSKKQFYNIKEIAKRSDINELIIATDAGREGELVARLIMEHIHWKKPFKRLWISSLTRQAIKEGFSRLKPGREYDNLFNAAKCRSEADWLIGLNVTRALTIKYNDQLSAGRVQTTPNYAPYTAPVPNYTPYTAPVTNYTPYTAANPPYSPYTTPATNYTPFDAPSAPYTPFDYLNNNK